MKKNTSIMLFGLLATASAAVAGDKTVVVPPVIEDPKTFCDIFDLATLYEGEGGLIQEIAWKGRYQGQWHYTDSSRGESSYWENRRFRTGFEIAFLDQFVFETVVNLKNESGSGDLIEDFDTMVLEWEPNDAFSIAVGKDKPAITQEYSTSSSKIKTIERSLLTNQVTPDKSGGVVFTVNDLAGFEVDLGAFTGGLTDDYELPEFNAGYALYLRVGRAISDATEVRFDYFYNDGDEGNDAFAAYENVFSLNSESQWGAFGLRTDIIAATGGDTRGDVYGLMLMPLYELTEKLELVGRYTFAAGEGDDSLRLASRYERPSIEDGGGERGDEYHSFYLGLNYYICGDNLKLMNGIEYSTLDGAASYDGWTYFAGVRINF